MFIYFFILRVKQFPFEKSAALHSEAPETKNLNNHEQTRMKKHRLVKLGTKKSTRRIISDFPSATLRSNPRARKIAYVGKAGGRL